MKYIEIKSMPECIYITLPKGTVIDPATTDLSSGKIGIKTDRPYKYKEIFKNDCLREMGCPKVDAYANLLLLAAHYNRYITSEWWVVDWKDSNQTKYYIGNVKGKLQVFTAYINNDGQPVFATRELAQLALDNNRELFEAYLA